MKKEFDKIMEEIKPFIKKKKVFKPLPSEWKNAKNILYDYNKK